MDRLQVCGIRCYGYTGFFEEERKLGQWFDVDLVFGLDVRVAGASDRLDDTLDYGGAVQRVQSLVRQARFATIERLATAIAEDILHHTVAEEVTVRLTKVSPPIPDFGGHIALEITRSRAELHPGT